MSGMMIRGVSHMVRGNILYISSTRVIRVLRRGSTVAAVFIADKRKNGTLKPWFATNNLRQRVSITARAVKIKDSMRGLYFNSNVADSFQLVFR